jgi:hypothetical protein
VRCSPRPIELPLEDKGNLFLNWINTSNLNEYISTKGSMDKECVDSSQYQTLPDQLR